MSGEDRACPVCGAGLAADQRYCLNCGHAVDPVEGSLRAAVAAAPGAAVASRPANPRLRRAGAFSGMLAAGLGVGVIAGALLNPSSAVQAEPYRLIEVQVPAAARPPAPTSTPSSTAPTAPAATAGPPLAPPTTVAETPSTTTTPETTTTSQTTTTTSTTTTTPTTTTSTTTTTTTTSTTPTVEPLKLPPIHHVWLVVLTDLSYNTLYGPNSVASYLNGTLLHEGTLLTDYYATAHGQLANGIALLSGQGPTLEQQSDCPLYNPLTPGTIDNATLQVLGNGCVFPSTVMTVPDELTDAHLTWRAYIAGQGAPGDPLTTCTHPALGAMDPTAITSTPANLYVTRRNPFVYFDSLLAQPSCSENDVGLSQLGADLAANQIPSLSWIAPDLCTAGEVDACPTGSATSPPPTTSPTTTTTTTPTTTTTSTSTTTPTTTTTTTPTTTTSTTSTTTPTTTTTTTPTTTTSTTSTTTPTTTTTTTPTTTTSTTSTDHPNHHHHDHADHDHVDDEHDHPDDHYDDTDHGAVGADRRRCGRRVPGAVDSADPGNRGLPQGRHDRDSLRPGARERPRS